jgi:hypothetical protein
MTITIPILSQRNKPGECPNLDPVLGFKRYTGNRSDISVGSVIELNQREKVTTKLGVRVLSGTTYFNITGLQTSNFKWVWVGYPIAYVDPERGLIPAPSPDKSRMFAARYLCGIQMDKASEVAIVEADAEQLLKAIAEGSSHAAA